jgi:histidine triad (HIT) family protein
MDDDVFCKIIKGELSGDIVYRDEEVVVMKDIHPKAPVHLLVVPVKHIDGIEDADEAVLAHMLKAAHRAAENAGLDKGYRLIMNEGEHGGKLVPHLHLHLLGGKNLGPKIVTEQ